MSVYSKILSLINGVARTVDFSDPANQLGVSAIQLLGSTSGHVQFSTSAVTSSYSVIFPAAQGAVSTFLQNDGSGNLSWGSVASSPVISNNFIAGQGYAANTSFIVRWGMNTLSETTDRVYKADYSTVSFDEFWAIGIAFSTTAVLTGQPIAVYSFGAYTLGSSDTPFSSADVGQPVWLTSAGAFSTTAPTGTSQADLKIGIVMSTTQIWIDGQMMGIGSSTGPGPFPMDVVEGGTGVASFTPYAIIAGGTTSTGPLQQVSGLGTSGFVLTSNGAGALPTWQASTGGVTSVALADSTGLFNITGSPVTSSGTLTLASFQSQAANKFFAAPNGSSGAPTFRAIVAADIPTLNQNTTGTAANVTATTNSTITTLSSLSLPGSQVSGNISGNAANVTGTVAIGNGGTGQTSAAAAFGALSPLTTKGDILGYDTANNRVPVGSNGQVLTADSTQALGLKWASPTSGSVTSVAFSDASTAPIYSVSGSPVTSAGTLTITLSTQSANTVFAGPSSGGAAQPSFRSLVSADIPSLSSIYLPLAGGTMSGNIAMGSHKLTGLSAGTTAGDSVRYEQAILASGVNAWTANQDLGGFLITGSGTPVNPGDLVPKSYVDNFINATSWKNAVLVATTANISLSGEQTIDGFTTSSSRVLVKNQSTASQNGIYVSASGSWTRALDMDSWSEVPAAAVFVQEGTVNADLGWVCTSQPGGTLGTTAITWVQFSSAGSYTADNVTLQLSSGVFSIKNGGVSNTQVSASAAIAFSKLAALTSAHILVGNGSAVATDVAVSGDLTLANTGAFTVAKIQGTVVSGTTGSTNVVFSASPTLTGTITADSANFSGQVGIGGSFNTNIGLTISSTNLTGTSQYGLQISPTVTTAATSAIVGSLSLLSIPASASTFASAIGYRALDVSVGAGSTLSNSVGFSSDDLTSGAVNIGFQSNVSSGANKYNFYAAGSALNLFTGSIQNTALTASRAVFTDASKNLVSNAITGTGNVVMSASPTFTGTITAAAANFSGAISASNFSGSSSGTNTGDQTITLTGDVTGSGTGSFATTVAKIAGTTVSGTTGTGNVVFSTSPVLVTPALGTPSALIGTNITGSATNFTATNISATSNSTLTTISTLVSVGTITTGVWNGTAVDVAHGGTGRATLTNHGILVGAGTTAITQLAVGSTGTILIGASAADPSFSATPTLGAVGTTGTLSFAGTTSGVVTVQPQSAAGTFNFNLPTSAGSAGQVLTSQGGVAAAMTWTTPTTGTVTSVAMTVPAFLSVSGSPVTSSGTLAVTLSGTALPIANGGTGQTTASAAYAALSPMTTLGDITYENATPAPTRLAGNTSTTLSVLTQTGNGTVSAAPVWTTSTGTGSVVLSTSPTLTTPALGTPSALVGTNITGTATNFTATNISATTNATLTTLSALTTASSLASIGTITTGTWSATTIAINKGGTGQTTATAAFNALSPMTTLGDIIYEDATPTPVRLAGNTTTTKKFLTQTGNGTISAVPGWNVLVSGDVPNNAANTSGSAGSISGTNVITNTNLSQMAATTIKGNNTAGTANATDLNVAQVLTMLGIMSGRTTITSGTTSQLVTFSTAYASATGYSVTANLFNSTDAAPQFQPVDITSQGTTGFTAKWNAPTDTANYVLLWQAILTN